MLFDPFEEEFNVPTAAVKLSEFNAGSEKLLVRNTYNFLVSGSRKLIRRSTSG
jgi:hypothetical protein